jgi:two-component system cell cycle sensor histidine kinase/response regulator CckA
VANHERSDEALRAGAARVLEQVATGVPLGTTLDTLVRFLEAQADGMLASILLVEDGRIRHAAAPNLPAEFMQLIDGEPIGPTQGSSGSAAFLKQTVIAEDIASDSHWVAYREAALACGLRACWAVPIMGSDQTVLGTCALYFRAPRKPTAWLLELCIQASHLAAVAIQHHRHEQSILENEALARLIVENALDANILMDQDGVVTGWNPRATAIFGWTHAEAMGQPLSKLIIPERSRAQYEDGLRRYLETGEGALIGRRLEISALHRDGREFPIELAVAPIKRGARVLFSAFIEDITARRQSEEALRESQQHLSLLYDHVDDVLFQLQVEPGGYRFVSVNPAFVAVTGIDRGQVIGKFVHEVIPEPSRALALERYGEAIRTGRTVHWLETTTYPSGTKHGDVAIAPVYDAQGKPKYLIGSVRDVTEQRRMEEEVRQLQKLEAVGRLSSGIAHDFNNILGVIVGVGNMVRSEIQDPEIRGQVEEIVKAAERGANLTRQFLAFGRKQVLKPKVLDLNSVLAELESMLRRLIRADITLVTAPAPGLWRVQADPGQIEQVVVNLVVNAGDAMPDGGRVVVETSNVTLDREYARTQHVVVAGEYVMLAVADTGHGMDEETRKRIFEPFFTTKGAGRGTGLGLATVYGIVRQSGGYVFVDSQPGQGATFRVYLPRSTAPVEPAEAEAQPPRDSGAQRRAQVHVLVVEDEPVLRRTFERMLRLLNYQVTVASSAEEALAAVGEDRMRPDLVLTDMIMPGMSGKVLIDRLRALRPEIKVLLMSGYAHTSTGSEGEEEPMGPFLQKPFDMNALGEGIEAALR